MNIHTTGNVGESERCHIDPQVLMDFLWGTLLTERQINDLPRERDWRVGRLKNRAMAWWEVCDTRVWLPLISDNPARAGRRRKSLLPGEARAHFRVWNVFEKADNLNRFFNLFFLLTCWFYYSSIWVSLTPGEWCGGYRETCSKSVQPADNDAKIWKHFQIGRHFSDVCSVSPRLVTVSQCYTSPADDQHAYFLKNADVQMQMFVRCFWWSQWKVTSHPEGVRQLALLTFNSDSLMQLFNLVIHVLEEQFQLLEKAKGYFRKPLTYHSCVLPLLNSVFSILYSNSRKLLKSFLSWNRSTTPVCVKVWN